MRRWLGRALLLLGGLALLLVAATAGFVRYELGRSLPPLVGTFEVQEGLQAEVKIERDAQGIPTIHAASFAEAICGLGFVHAQDRYFQMDLLRRSAAGEVAELIGPAALKYDRRVRVHRLRKLSQEVLAAAPPHQRAVVKAYTQGVQRGLASLASQPFEYTLLSVNPRAWAEEDSALAMLAMFLALQADDFTRESCAGLIADQLPAELAELLAVPGTEWDAPLIEGPVALPKLPGPDVFDVRKDPPRLELPLTNLDEISRGSNNWAIAGTRTKHRGALVANDMHLDLRLPNIWYRAVLRWPDEQTPGKDWQACGATLPGGPAFVVGSNEKVAWGFTNVEGDWSDLVLIEPDPNDPENSYLTAEGAKKFQRIEETIKVRGAADFPLAIEHTIWGPIWDRDYKNRKRALKWVAHDPQGVNFEIVAFAQARTLDDLLDRAARAGGPQQNLVAADDRGRIGFTIQGRIPQRVGFSGRVPTSWADGKKTWDGFLPPEQYPRIVDPAEGLLWTANGRTLPPDQFAWLGDSGFDLGARSTIIRDGLRAQQQATEADQLKLMRENRSVLHDRWQKLLLKTLSDEVVAGDPQLAELRQLIAPWQGEARIDAVDYRLVSEFRLRVIWDVYSTLTALCQRADRASLASGPQAALRERFHVQWLPRQEGPVWAILQERPPHLLDPQFSSWDDCLLKIAKKMVQDLTADGTALSSRTWGAQNTVQMRHPLSQGVPGWGWLADLPAKPLPGGWAHVPAVQSPTDGASQRMIVSPGREAEGIFHMPGGQSGHPLSPNYGDGQGAWETGHATPFLPGPALHTLTLVPAK